MDSEDRDPQHCADLESRYFPSPKQKKTTMDLESAVFLALPPTQPRLPQHRLLLVDTDTLKYESGFRLFYEDFIAAMLELYYAKPLLIQEHVSSDPWKVLIAVTLLNKTAGKKSIPVFFEIMDAWPTPVTLAEAPLSLLFELLKDLGLGQMRSQRLIDISQSFMSDPPVPDKLRPSRGKTTELCLAKDSSIVIRQVKYPPTPISHLPGCGPYALDSYRIFCAGENEWKNVRPTDKELVKYLQWRWAVERYQKWDPVHGPRDSIDLDYVRGLTASLTAHPISY